MKKVLVVEDEPSIAHLIADSLEQAGYRVEIAEDGEQACARVESFVPDLVTLDLLLPLKSGWQVLEYIRRHAEASVRQVPIIVVSALASQRQQKELQHSGVHSLFKQAVFHCRTLSACPPPARPGFEQVETRRLSGNRLTSSMHTRPGSSHTHNGPVTFL